MINLKLLKQIKMILILLFVLIPFQNCGKLQSNTKHLSSANNTGTNIPVNPPASTGSQTPNNPEDNPVNIAPDSMFSKMPSQKHPIVAAKPSAENQFPFYINTITISPAYPHNLTDVLGSKHPIFNYYHDPKENYPPTVYTDKATQYEVQTDQFIPFGFVTHCIFPGDTYSTKIDDFMSKDGSGNYTIMKQPPAIYYKLFNSKNELIAENYDNEGGFENRYRMMNTAYGTRKWIKKDIYKLHIKNISKNNLRLDFRINKYSPGVDYPSTDIIKVYKDEIKTFDIDLRSNNFRTIRTSCYSYTE